MHTGREQIKKKLNCTYQAHFEHEAQPIFLFFIIWV